LKLKFQTVAEKTAKNFRGLLYFAAHGSVHNTWVICRCSCTTPMRCQWWWNAAL